MLRPLDVSSHMMRGAPDELGLVCQPIGMYSILAFTVFLVFLHDNMSRTQPSDFHQIRLARIPPEPYLLPQAVLGVEPLVLCTKCSTKAFVSVSFNHRRLSGTATSQRQFKILMASEVGRFEVVGEQTACQLRLVAQHPLSWRKSSHRVAAIEHIELRDAVDQRLFNALRIVQVKISAVDFNGFAQQRMSPFD